MRSKKCRKQGQFAFVKQRKKKRRKRRREKQAGRRETWERKKGRVPHRTRETFASRYPVHVTLTVREGLPNLRRGWTFDVVRFALAKASDRFGVRIIHFTVQSNHIHLLVEARGKEALSKAMQGLGVRLAKRLNKEWDRQGRVFADRYHAHVLRTPTETANAKNYLRHNGRKHGERYVGEDPCCSEHERCHWVTEKARTWLLTEGYKRGVRPRGDARAKTA